MIDKLHIDIETFSSVDIRTCGSYKYAQSLDFEILLVGFAFNDEPVKCIDLARGEKLPKRFTKGLLNSKIEKHAHNANFERNCFRVYGYDVPIDQWMCTQVKSASCGLPLALADVSKALDLKEKGKLATGRALIRFFCIPCKPSKANDNRHRNLPKHDTLKWVEFIEYCINDVEAEREIDRILSGYDIGEFERKNYILDQQINDKGVLVDLVMAHSAYEIDRQYSKKLMERAKQITKLDNPNSPAQLKSWLSNAIGRAITTLAKDSIPKLIEESESDDVREILEIRQKASRTSVKKYISMINCACDDGRARGLFQFYGANRTGRWAGRLVQLQNLKRNYLTDLKEARTMIRAGDMDHINMVYDDVSDVLSQLTRTAFISKPGHVFRIADFSAIEARVTAWLAGEQWRIDIFKGDGKIYEASAAMMFNVPISEVTKDSEYRYKAKVAELALGYQGGVGAMTKMSEASSSGIGGDSGLSQLEMKEIVRKWRIKSPSIVKFWHGCERAAKKAYLKKTIIETKFQGIKFSCDKNILYIHLPSGRKLAYWSPSLTTNRFNSVALQFKGMDQKTKQFVNIDTYGGKLVENIVQAVARDVLAHSMYRLYEEGFDIMMHVHDEACAEQLIDDKQLTLKKMCEVMSEDVPWAPGLPLTADGYETPFYKKD